nr:YicC family protein [candidate division Zixibacteria bacterium]
MYSMTGYGKAVYKTKDLAVSVEISSVNNRFLEYSFRLPKQISFLEAKFKELISSQISRGKINLAVSYEDYGIGVDRLVVNRKLADEMYRQLAEMKKKYKLTGSIELTHLLGFHEVFKVEKSDDIEDRIWPPMKRAVEKALKDLGAMRKREGANLKKDLVGRLKILNRKIGLVEKLADENVTAYRQKLTKRIQDILENRALNTTRLEEEVVYMAERADITEECVRFKSHLKQFDADLKKGGSLGKRLNFILQEMNRETNTIGSKSANTEISHLVLGLKEEVEKMREQVQNLE